LKKYTICDQMEHQTQLEMLLFATKGTQPQ
jgi:hypothetical protein